MATLNFPDPSVTQTYTEAGITWTWNSSLGVWSSEAGQVPGGGDVSVDVGDTRPSLPSQGDLWFCTAEREDGGGRLYVYYMDEDSGQWVDVSQPGGALTQTIGDGRYLQLDASNDPVTGECDFQAGLRTAFVNARVGNNRLGVNNDTTSSGFTFNTNGLTAAAAGVRGILSNFGLASAVATDVTLVQANISGTTTASGDINGFTFTRTGGVAISTTGDLKAFVCGLDNDVNAGTGDTYCLHSSGSAPSYHVGDFRIGSGNLNGAPGINLGQGNTILGTKFFEDGGATFNSNASTTLSISNNSSGNSNRLINFWVGGQSGVCGKFYANSNTSMILDHGLGGDVVGTSDYRAKTNINELGTASEIVKALRPVAFNFNEDLDKTHVGFIAHELQEHIPSAVYGEKDAVDEEGSPQYQGVSQIRLVPYLTKALQEVIAKNEDLEARLAALEGA